MVIAEPIKKRATKMTSEMSFANKKNNSNSNEFVGNESLNHFSSKEKFTYLFHFVFKIQFFHDVHPFPIRKVTNNSTFNFFSKRNGYRMKVPPIGKERQRVTTAIYIPYRTCITSHMIFICFYPSKVFFFQ